MLWDMENLGGRDFQNLEIKRFGDGVFFVKGLWTEWNGEILPVCFCKMGIF